MPGAAAVVRRGGGGQARRIYALQPSCVMWALVSRADRGSHDALARWAGDERRSTSAQIDFLLRRALAEAGRMPETTS